MGAPVSARRRAAEPAWSTCAWVTTIRVMSRNERPTRFSARLILFSEPGKPVSIRMQPLSPTIRWQLTRPNGKMEILTIRGGLMAGIPEMGCSNGLRMKPLDASGKVFRCGCES